MAKITYEDKVKLQDEPDIPNKNKVTDNDMNEIKDVVNINADELDTAKENIENLEEGQGTNSTDIINLKGRMTTLETDNAKNKSDISNLQKDNETNKTNISNLRNSKVDKIEGKGLSTEDFTTQLKTKLEGLENYNDTEIQEKIQTIEGKVQTLEDDNASNKTNISTLQGKVTNLEKDNTTNKGNISNLQENVEDLGKDIEENTTNIETLQAENKNLKAEIASYKNSLPRETLSGEYITMQNTADKVKFKDFVLGGNSKQENSEVGNNILCINEFTNENGGLEQSYSVADDILSLNGSRSNNVSTVCEVKLYFKESGNYKIIKEDVSGDFSNGSIGIRAYNASEERLFFVQISNTGSLETSGEITEEMIKQISRTEIYTTTGAVFNDYKCKIMLTKESITEYEKFTPNRPSPEYPSKIENVEGDVEVTVANKNIFDGLWTGNVSTNFIPVFAGKKYIYSENGSRASMNYRFYKNTNETYEQIWVGANNSFIPETNGYIKLFKDNSTKTNCMLNIGDTIEEYVQHQEQTITFPLAQGQKLMLNDYLADDGIHHIRKQRIIDGTETINIYGRKYDEGYAYKVFIDNVKADTEVLSTKYKYIPFADFYYETNIVGKCSTHNTTGGYILFGSSKATIEEFKEEILGTTVEYELAEEETEEYTEEQQEAYNKLKELTTYATQTNIYSTSNIKPVFKVTGIKDVNSLITQVNQLILENGGN